MFLINLCYHSTAVVVPVAVAKLNRIINGLIGPFIGMYSFPVKLFTNENYKQIILEANNHLIVPLHVIQRQKDASYPFARTWVDGYKAMMISMEKHADSKERLSVRFLRVSQ